MLEGLGHSFNRAKESAAAFETLYMNVDGLGDAWARMWARVAARFKGADQILGLELLNEPFAGNLHSNPLIMIPWPNPWNADRMRLQPAYGHAPDSTRRNVLQTQFSPHL
jgi:aryl-phospho-beta-D-glucosidase BglC (GH1 family)